MTPSEALQHILTLVKASADLKDDTQRRVLLRSVIVVAQKGLGVAPDRPRYSCRLNHRQYVSSALALHTH